MTYYIRKHINLFENQNDSHDEALYNNLHKLFSATDVASGDDMTRARKIAQAIMFFSSEDILVQQAVDFRVLLPYDQQHHASSEYDYCNMILALENTQEGFQVLNDIIIEISENIYDLFHEGLEEIGFPTQHRRHVRRIKYDMLLQLDYKILLATRKFQKIYGNVNPLKHMSAVDLLSFAINR